MVGQHMRRGFDVVCAAAGLVLLAPLFAAIALAIKLDDGGPVFYHHTRIGKKLRRFTLFKFRSMVPGAECSGLLTAPQDTRLTRCGRHLRRLKLDELPQLLNVLKGEMQLVGPRPEVPRYVEMFPVQYQQLLRDRPGITDPATQAFRREEKMFTSDNLEEQYVARLLPHKLRLSLAYQERRSFFSDLRILLHTVLGIGSRPAGHESVPPPSADFHRTQP